MWNSTVNITGRPGGYLASDRFQEFMILHLKHYITSLNARVSEENILANSQAMIILKDPAELVSRELWDDNGKYNNFTDPMKWLNDVKAAVEERECYVYLCIRHMHFLFSVVQGTRYNIDGDTHRHRRKWKSVFKLIKRCLTYKMYFAS